MNIFNSIKSPYILILTVITVSACSKQDSPKETEEYRYENTNKAAQELEVNLQTSQSYVSDSEITERISEAILSEPEISIFDINVLTDIGIATLKGTVNSTDIKNKIEDLVSRIEGVKGVKNKLVVELDN